MLLIIFLIAIVFAAICLLLGVSNNSFPLVYLAFFVILIMGLLLFSGGLQLQSGIAETPPGSGTFLTLYESHTAANDPVISLLANTFLYIPVAGILLTTFIAIRT